MKNREHNHPNIIQGPLWNRRSFLKSSVLSAMSAALGIEIVHAAHLPASYVPLAFTVQDNPLKEKIEEMIVRNDKPWNVKTPQYLLDDTVTPFPNIFIRNNGHLLDDIDVSKYALAFGGVLVMTENTYCLDELINRFKAYTYQLVWSAEATDVSVFNLLLPVTSGNKIQR